MHYLDIISTTKRNCFVDSLKLKFKLWSKSLSWPCLFLFPMSVLLYWHNLIFVGSAISMILVSYPKKALKVISWKFSTMFCYPALFRKSFQNYVFLTIAFLVVCLYATIIWKKIFGKKKKNPVKLNRTCFFNWYFQSLISGRLGAMPCLECSNYRAISLLSSLDKIIEKCMHERVMKFLNEHNILYQKLFSFQKKKKKIPTA